MKQIKEFIPDMALSIVDSEIERTISAMVSILVYRRVVSSINWTFLYNNIIKNPFWENYDISIKALEDAWKLL